VRVGGAVEGKRLDGGLGLGSGLGLGQGERFFMAMVARVSMAMQVLARACARLVSALVKTRAMTRRRKTARSGAG
jgi:hypothetical protein